MPPPTKLFASSASLPAYARTNGRGVRLRIHPRPANIGERGKILGVLQKYGHVIAYQSLKYDPTSKAQNIVLALYRQQEDAKKLLEASPLHLEMGTWGVREAPKMGLDGHTSANDPSSDHSPASRFFSITVDRAGTNFHAYYERQPYSGPFELDRDSAMYADLESRVPVQAMADCQFDKPEVLLRLKMKRLETEQWEKRGASRQNLWEIWKGQRV